MAQGEPLFRRLSDVAPVPCPCGESRRIIAAGDGPVAGFHVTHIVDAQPHYHRNTAEIYHILDGSGRLRIGGSSFDLELGATAYVPPECVHAGEGDFTAAIVCVPPFDPSDEYVLGATARLPRPCKRPIFRRLSEVPQIASHCGTSRRVITRDDDVVAGLHVVQITDAAVHYHDRTTEIYHILQGEGTLQVGDEVFDLEPGATIYIPTGTPHGGQGDFTAIVVCIPPFDPNDQIVV